MTFAVIQTGGKQYKVASGQKLKISKIEAENGAVSPKQSKLATGQVNFDKVLLVADGEDVKIGAPYVNGAKVEAKILKQGRDRKKIVFKYLQKTRRGTKRGHRQHFTEVEITKVGV